MLDRRQFLGVSIGAFTLPYIGGFTPNSSSGTALEIVFRDSSIHVFDLSGIDIFKDELDDPFHFTAHKSCIVDAIRVCFPSPIDHGQETIRANFTTALPILLGAGSILTIETKGPLVQIV